MILDVGCGYLKSHKRRNGIGIDLNKGCCDIIADINHLPFRDAIFSFIYARNVLEHLDNPFVGLGELQRVMKKHGGISITIPIHANLFHDELLKIIFAFPFRLVVTVHRLIRWRKHSRDKGFWHKNNIKPQQIAQFFSIKNLCLVSTKHELSHGIKGKFLRRMGINLWHLPDSYYILGQKEGLKTD